MMNRLSDSNLPDESGDFYLPVSMAMEVAYCPRNFYLRYIENNSWRDHRMERGLIQDDRRKKGKTTTTDGKLLERDVEVVSEILGLFGKVDVIELDEMAPVENKTGSQQKNEYDLLQLCCYGMMIEEMTGRSCKFGYLYYTESKFRKKIDFTEDLRNRVEEAAESAWDILLSGDIPPPLDSTDCSGCAMKDICMPDQITQLQGKEDKIPSKIGLGKSYERTVCIDEQFGYLRISKGVFQFSKNEDLIKEFPAELIDSMVLIGNINFSSYALKEIMKRNIHVSLLSYGGRFEGEIISEYSKNVPLKIAQVKASLDSNYQLEFAKGFLEGKLANSITLINRYNRSRNVSEVDAHIKRMKDIKKELRGHDNYQVLLGLEGAAASSYFEAFRKLIDDPDFEFGKRVRRPPDNPVNAMLGFGYTLLASQIRGLCYLVGLDPAIGFLHRQKYGRPALVLDVMEEFRSIIVDSMVLNIISRKMIKKNHFEWKQPRSCLLNESGREIFIRMFFDRMRDTVVHPLVGYDLPYRRIIEIQLRLLARRIMGEYDRYIPFKAR